MKQVVITSRGGPGTLQARDAPDPQPGPNELRIRVKAAGINFADILARQGRYPDAPKIPCVVGYEVSGVVDAAGHGARQDWVGKPAIALTHFGGYADTIVVPDTHVVEKPSSLTHEQGAALLVNYLTAWQLLVVMGALRAGETVLIHNAGGGVGLAAIDIARHVGATIYGTASPGKHPFLKERGVHEAIDYAGRDWLPEVMRLTGGRGVELILDPLGGSHWKKSYRALRHTGRLGMFGASTSTNSRLPGALALLGVGLGMPWFNPVGLMNQNRGAFGVNLGHLWHEVEKIRAWMGILIEGVRDGWIRPHVDRSFPLADAGLAQAYMEARKNTGKVVLTT